MEKIIQPKIIYPLYFLRSLLVSFYVPPLVLLGVSVEAGFFSLPMLTTLLIFSLIYASITLLMGAYFKHSRYEIQKERIKFRNDFLSYIHRELKLNNVAEVMHYKGVLQRRFGVGTVVLIRQGLLPGVGVVKLTDMENSEELYKDLRKLVDQNENTNAGK